MLRSLRNDFFAASDHNFWLCIPLGMTFEASEFYSAFLHTSFELRKSMRKIYFTLVQAQLLQDIKIKFFNTCFSQKIKWHKR
jgi:hypothetical protein